MKNSVDQPHSQTQVKSHFKKPNSRHFYADPVGHRHESGLKIDYVKFQNTVIRPGIDVAADVAAINAGRAKYKELFYIPVYAIRQLNFRIALSFSIYFCLLGLLSSGQLNLAMLPTALIFWLPIAWVFAWVSTWVATWVYASLGKSRANVAWLLWNITFSIMSFSVLFYFYIKGTSILSLFSEASTIFMTVFVSPLAMTWIGLFNVRKMARVKVEPEWMVHHRCYGGHANERDEIVLYPKRGQNFYCLDPHEYRMLAAYQKTGGDRNQSKALMQLWRGKPLADQIDKKLMERQASNLLYQSIIFAIKVIFTLLTFACKGLAHRSKNPALTKLQDQLNKRGFDRVFWIYQDCEAALQATRSPKKAES